MLLGSRRAISGESISSLQVFPKVRRTRGERLEDYFVDDDGCEYSLSCLQCPLPVCKYDDPVGSFLWVMRRRLFAKGEGVQIMLFPSGDTGVSPGNTPLSVGDNFLQVTKKRGMPSGWRRCS